MGISFGEAERWTENRSGPLSSRAEPANGRRPPKRMLRVPRQTGCPYGHKANCHQHSLKRILVQNTAIVEQENAAGSRTQFQAGTSRVLEARRSDGDVAGRLGKPWLEQPQRVLQPVDLKAATEGAAGALGIQSSSARRARNAPSSPDERSELASHARGRDRGGDGAAAPGRSAWRVTGFPVVAKGLSAARTGVADRQHRPSGRHHPRHDPVGRVRGPAPRNSRGNGGPPPGGHTPASGDAQAQSSVPFEQADR